jgi:hypothetical protein
MVLTYLRGIRDIMQPHVIVHLSTISLFLHRAFSPGSHLLPSKWQTMIFDGFVLRYFIISCILEFFIYSISFRCSLHGPLVVNYVCKLSLHDKHAYLFAPIVLFDFRFLFPCIMFQIMFFPHNYFVSNILAKLFPKYLASDTIKLPQQRAGCHLVSWKKKA